jgi:intracellular sulfur oxidation DsrE/DsrF family protein
MINNITKYTNSDGTPTIELIKFGQEVAALKRENAEFRAKFAAIAAVADPAGGGTVDSQGRTAIIAIIDGAA